MHTVSMRRFFHDASRESARKVVAAARVVASAAFAVILVLACTPAALEPERPGPEDAAARFVVAWDERDHAAMAQLLHPATPWTPERLEDLLDSVATDGAVTDMDVSHDAQGAVVEGERASVPYELTYSSEAMRDEATLEGELELVYSEERAAWHVAWGRHVLWPGMARADRFSIATRYPRRAPLLDRARRRLAVGPAPSRRYPHGSLAGTTIGHLEPLAKKDIEPGEARAPGDLVGASGLEEAFEERLAGRPATRLQVLGRRGKVLVTLGKRAARRARPLRTTLDVEIQRAAQAGYGGTTGGAVVLDPRTGDILAAVASSPFDPNNYVGVAGIQPFNRALSGLYPPGSAMKVVTAAAALDGTKMTPSTQLRGPAEYRGVRNFESGEFGTLSFAGALQHSVNTAFAQIAERLGAKRMTRYAERFGFNDPPAMPLEAGRSSFPEPEGDADLMWGAIGQAQVLATPLQMATIAATIANDGKRMGPRISFAQRPGGRRVVSRRTARTMTDLMENVVQSGTGTGAAIAGVRVAGKTGTAEVDVGGERRNHAWFICFAPAQNPKVAVAVVAEYGGVGGRVAAPLARAILARVLPLLR